MYSLSIVSHHKFIIEFTIYSFEQKKKSSTHIHLSYRNMVLQNESIDDELEHFEDVIEETDNEPSTVSNTQIDNTELVQNGEDANSDTNSSEGEDDLPASSEDDDSDDASEDAGFFCLQRVKLIIRNQSLYLIMKVSNHRYLPRSLACLEATIRDTESLLFAMQTV